MGKPDIEMLDNLPSKCKWIAHKGAGYDAFDTAAMVKRGECTIRGARRRRSAGISLSNTPGAVDEATATTAVYLLIACMRRFTLSESVLREGGFAPIPEVESQAHDLEGRTIGILGMGSIGLRFAQMIRPFNMKMIYHNRNPNKLAPDWVEYVPDYHTFLKQTDVLSVHIPLSKATIGFVGEKEIRMMQKGSIIVNTARGKVIDEEAMIKALEDGHVSRAGGRFGHDTHSQLATVGLDVFASEPLPDKRLVAMKNTTLLPHVGTENQDARRKMEVKALSNIRDFLTKGVGQNLVVECQSLHH